MEEVMSIDWNKPLEAYHPDGRVIEISASAHYVARTDDDGYYWVSELACWFRPEGRNVSYSSSWRIRNRTEKPALTEDMVRKAMDDGQDETIAILREHGVLAKPVDRDLEMARELCDASPYSLDDAPYKVNADILGLVLAAIKRARAEYE